MNEQEMYWRIYYLVSQREHDISPSIHTGSWQRGPGYTTPRNMDITRKGVAITIREDIQTTYGWVCIKGPAVLIGEWKASPDIWGRRLDRYLTESREG